MFGGAVSIIDDPAIAYLARGSSTLDARVGALARALTTVANRIEKSEKRHPPLLSRSDAVAARILLRLGPDYASLTVDELQAKVASSWQKRDRGSGGTAPLTTEGFRKRHQPAFYARLAAAVDAYLTEVDGRSSGRPEAGPAVASGDDVAASWNALVELTQAAATSQSRHVLAIAETVADLDAPVRALLSTADDAANGLAEAAVRYARELHAEGRDRALVSFRSNISETLHIIGQHKARGELGALAMDAASGLGNTLAEAEILVDDLGWGAYMQDDVDSALENISSAESIALEAISTTPDRASDLTIVAARAIRHRSIIEAELNRADMTEQLAPALKLLEKLDSSRELVRREISQLAHARGLITAIYCGVNGEGDLPKDGQRDATRRRIEAVLPDVGAAAETFRELGDQARYTKALFLEVRLLEACGKKLEARRARAIRDRALASSEWSRPGRVTTLERV